MKRFIQIVPTSSEFRLGRQILMMMKAFALVLTVATLHIAQADDMQKYRSETRELVRQGKHEEALKRILWFHDHALEHEPSMYGVRLSFALSDWKELGDVYPPAAKALLETRDRKVARIRDRQGNRELFHDVLALNRTLEQDAETIRLFEWLHEHHPDEAKKYWGLVKDTVLAQKRYDIAEKQIRDVGAEFETVKARYDENVRLYKEPQLIEGALKSYNERTLVREAIALIQFALSRGDRAAALAIQKKASALVDDPQLSESIPAKGDQR